MTSSTPPRAPLSSRSAVPTLAALLVALPVTVDLVVGGLKRAFIYLAADTFYYLTVARNMVTGGGVTFDRSHGTNGFHPLWQFTLAALYGVARLFHISDGLLLCLMIVVNAAALALGVYLFGRALERSGRLNGLYLLVPFGLYGLLLLPVWIYTAHGGPWVNRAPLFGTVWSYANGMESSFALGLFGALAWAWMRAELDDERAGWRLGGLLALLALARLDQILFAAGIFPVLFLYAWKRPPLRRPAARFALAFVIPILVYCGINYAVYGVAMPVSGKLKSSFPHIGHGNIDRLIDTVTNPTKQGYWRVFRELQMVVPFIAAILYALRTLRLRRAAPFVVVRDDADRLQLLVAAFSPGVAALALYNFLFVDLPEQGHWYFPVSTFYVSIALLSIWPKTNPITPAKLTRMALYALTSMAVIAGFIWVQVHPLFMRNYADFFFDEAPRVRAFYGANPPRLLEADDGIVAYATGFPAMAAKGFALDTEGIHALQTGQLVPLAVARGYDRLVAFEYGDARSLHLNMSSLAVWRAFGAIATAANFQHLTFSVEYVSPSFAVVKMEKR